MAQLPSAEPTITSRSFNPRMKQLIPRLFLAALIAFALYLFGSGFADNQSKPPSRFPLGLEDVSPVNASTNVPRQSTIMADLAFGYTGVLIITGKEKPTEIKPPEAYRQK